MEDLITVFRMIEISKETRIRIICKLGTAFDCSNGGNYSGPLVYELVKLLDPSYKFDNLFLSFNGINETEQ